VTPGHTPHFTLHTPHSTLQTPHSTLLAGTGTMWSPCPNACHLCLAHHPSHARVARTPVHRPFPVDFAFNLDGESVCEIGETTALGELTTPAPPLAWLASPSPSPSPGPGPAWPGLNGRPPSQPPFPQNADFANLPRTLRSARPCPHPAPAPAPTPTPAPRETLSPPLKKSAAAGLRNCCKISGRTDARPPVRFWRSPPNAKNTAHRSRRQFPTEGITFGAQMC
jgi:hypothetical protein